MNPAKVSHPSALRQFMAQESAGGIVLIAAAALAMIVANSPLSAAYFDTLHIYVGPLSIQHWINDALMAIFFLYVGLELKREFLVGQLARWSDRILPGVCAIAGMLAPALIYVSLNMGRPEALRGWAIPAATDIAFALGVLAILGSRVPISLKVFLTALAVLDDMGAVLIIALFYTANLNIAPLALAFAVLAGLFILNRMRVRALWPYLAFGVLLLIFVYQSGVHASLSGVALALAIPLRESTGAYDEHRAPLIRLEHALSPWVAFAIVPIFGFANAGVSFAGMTWQAALDTVPLGIAAGLFLGKQLGIFLVAWIVIRFGYAQLPPHASWRQFYGVGVLAGIGFTMSLFIGFLAFDDPLLQDEVKIGVIGGSLLSAALGYALLRTAPRSAPAPA